MLSHEQVWAAIDSLATRYGLSPSGLARRAGLDPTTFNPSKRVAGDGRPRWPSTESLAKILEATGEPLNRFVAKIEDNASNSDGTEDTLIGDVLVPVAGFSDATNKEAFDPQGRPIGPGWTSLSFPAPKERDAFALEVSGTELMPLYRPGDIVIAAPSLPIKRGDRVVVKARSHTLSILRLHRRARSVTEFRTLGEKSDTVSLEHSEIEWIARIIWASQ